MRIFVTWQVLWTGYSDSLSFIVLSWVWVLTELDCKKQFDNINPAVVLKSFSEASKWIYKKRRWRQVNLQWSINKDTPKLDRPGQATNTRFWHLEHDVLSRLLQFELQENNVLQSVGTLWRRETSIPMGGPFSAQCADLHTRDWGDMTISDTGHVYWSRGTSWFSLCQFRDTILMATNRTPSTSTTLVNTVPSTLSDVWNLEVLCPCLDGGAACCEGACLSNTIQALGISMMVGGGVGTSSAHPSSLTDTWVLRHGKPLITPCRAAPEYLPCIFISSLTGALPW